MKMRQFFPLLMIMLMVVVAGCGDDDDSSKDILAPQEEETVVSIQMADSSWTSRINATDYDSFTYLNLETHEEVELTNDQASSSNDWHIAFSRINGKLNGGASGPGLVSGVDLQDMADNTDLTFDQLEALPEIADDQWEEDTPRLIIDDLFYDYNPVMHRVEMTNNIFIVYTTNKKYVKFYVSAMEDAGMPPNLGMITLTYVYQVDGSKDLSGNSQTMTVDGRDGIAYLSFAQAGEVQVDDPMANSNWDLCFFYNEGQSDSFDDDRYSLKGNSGISGSETVGIYPMYLETDDFASIEEAPVGGGYFTDNMESIFGAPTVPGSEWYNYDMNSGRHEIISKEHVYLVRLDSGKVFKLMIDNYYHPETGHSGFVTLRYRELP